MSDLILTSNAQGIFTITLNRFDKKNALNTEMYQQICQHFKDAMTNENIHCLVIQGNAECFTAGNDLDDFLQCSHDEDLAALEFVRTLAEFNKPLIAAVAGAAVGIGTTLLLHCDMVIAANNSKFKLPFTQLGLCPEAGSSLLLTQRVGHNRAFELLVLGKTFSAEQAFEYGIINQVCQPNELLSIASNVASSIAKLPQDAVLTSKKLMRQANQAMLPQIIKEEGEQFVRLMNTEECKNILSSFFKTK